MRAAIFNEVGKEVIDVYDDVEVADPGPGEVRLKLHAAGVCHSDLSAMNGTLPQPAPAVLGHEGAGEIIEVGAGVDQVAVGDHVIVAWTPPCGKCAACLRGEANLCVEIFFNIAGAAKFSPWRRARSSASPGTGTFAEEMVLPQQGVVKIPDDVPYEIGALIGCGVTTGVGAALNTAKVRPGLERGRLRRRRRGHRRHPGGPHRRRGRDRGRRHGRLQAEGRPCASGPPTA